MVQWYGIGKIDGVPASQRVSRLSRFFIKAGESKLIVFLDDLLSEDKLFMCYEHNPVVDGNYFYYFTCSIDNCYLCKQGNRASDVKFLTCLELVNDQSGKLTGVYKSLFPIKWFGGVYYAWEKVKLSFPVFQKQTLRFAKFGVNRISTKEPSVGGTFTYLGHLTDNEIKIIEAEAKKVNLDLTPIDYIKELGPKDEAYFTQLINNGTKIVYSKPKYETKEQPVPQKVVGQAQGASQQFGVVRY
jgi:hypothetical protein